MTSSGMIRTPFRRRFAAALLALGLAAAPALAQQRPAARAVPEGVAGALREAVQLLQTVRSSNLDAWWRANALARTARVYARLGDGEAAKTMSGDALQAADEPFRTPPPAGLSLGAILAILAQTHADIGDAATAQALAQRAVDEIGKLADADAKATLFPYLGMALAEIGARDAAALVCLQGLKAAQAAAQPRDRVTALSLIAAVQYRIGDQASASDSLDAALQALKAVSDPISLSVATAEVARAEAALGQKDRAHKASREAAVAYDRGGTDPLPMFQRVSALTLIAVAQVQAGDRTGARATMSAARQTLARVTQPYERLTALLAIADADIQIERGAS